MSATKAENARRIKKILEAAKVYGDIDPRRDFHNYEVEEAMRDMLADMRHLCDKLGADFAAIDKTAHKNYLSEVILPKK